MRAPATAASVALCALSFGCAGVAPYVPPEPAVLVRSFAVPPTTVYHHAVRVALEERYEVLVSDAAGGVLRLKRLHEGEYDRATRFDPRPVVVHYRHTDYLTLLVQPAAPGSRVTVQTRAMSIPDTSGPAERPLVEPDTTVGPSFLGRLTAALAEARPVPAMR